MNLITSRRSRWTVLTLDGRFDAHVTPQVTAWSAEQLGANRQWHLVTLAHVHFVDSSALAAVVQGM